eukprot:1547027-Pyramimonas_sp.AAC.1
MSLPETGPEERFSKKSTQCLLQEHMRRLLDNRGQKRARSLPSLDGLPLGLQEPKDTAAAAPLKELLHRTTRHCRPTCACMHHAATAKAFRRQVRCRGAP